MPNGTFPTSFDSGIIAGMGNSGWLADNLFNLVSAVGVIGSLLFTSVSLRSETKTRRISNLIAITANHRDVWKIFLSSKELGRVRDASANTAMQPITDEERVFVNMVIQHMNSVFFAMQDQLVVKVEGFRRDIAQFMALPIPREVWDKIKVLQNDEFVAFVESCRNWK
jgi:hypothetical protein